MKRIEEIERLSLEDLERISEDASIRVPEGLESRVAQSLGRSSRSAAFRWVGIAASLVLIVGAAALMRPKPLKDTFDDPVLAYAAIENALAKVRPGVEAGVLSVAKGEDLLRKPGEVINTINNY